MSRSGYSDDYEHINLYTATVERAIKGKRGQRFFKGLAKALDEMPVKRLIAGSLETPEGEVCAIGAYCNANNIPTNTVDAECREEVGKLVDIAPCLAAQVAFENDDDFGLAPWNETPEQRWTRIRKMVQENIVEEK